MWGPSGGYLSLTKYICYINSLLVELENSRLCCSILHIPSSPAGYADDLAGATVSKERTDRVHSIVSEYRRKWRFKFNASKSAVMVFGEDKKENSRNKEYRVFKLDKERVKDRISLTILGLKCNFLQTIHPV